MEQKYILGIFAFVTIAILGISLISAFGFGKGFMNSDFTDEEKTEMQEEMEVMKTAITNGNYETWKSLMKDRIVKMQEFIEDEEHFNELVERHQEMRERNEEMKEKRGQFCEENDCPNFKEGNMNLRGAFAPRMKSKIHFMQLDSE